MEKIILFQLFECLTVVFETFIVYQYISGLFQKQDKHKSALLWYFLFCIGLMLLSLFFQKTIALTAYTLVGVFALVFWVYNASISSSIFSVFYFAAIMMAAEIFTTGLVSGIWKISLPNMFEYGEPRVLCIVITKLIQILLVKVSVYIAKWRTKPSSRSEYRFMLPLLLCQIFSIVLAYYVFVICSEIYGGFDLISLFAMAGIMYINIIVFWYFDRVKLAFEYKIKSEAAELKNELQMKYHEILNAHQQETDALWHDMKKHINLMKALINNGQNQITEEYIQELETQMDDKIKIIRTQHPILSTLLTEQNQRARKMNISFSLDVKLESEIKTTPLDLCIILGNLFDNSFEACALLPQESDRFVCASIVQKDTAIAIKIENSFALAVKPKSRNGKHGLGLKNVRSVVDKYNGIIDIKTSNNVFSVSIVIP